MYINDISIFALRANVLHKPCSHACSRYMMLYSTMREIFSNRLDYLILLFNSAMAESFQYVMLH